MIIGFDAAAVAREVTPPLTMLLPMSLAVRGSASGCGVLVGGVLESDLAPQLGATVFFLPRIWRMHRPYSHLDRRTREAREHDPPNAGLARGVASNQKRLGSEWARWI